MFPELIESGALALQVSRGNRLQVSARSELIHEIVHQGQVFPINAVEFGSTDPESPVLVFTGGIHGLERIGTWVCLAFMHHLHARLDWDESAAFLLKKLRVIFVPLINPVGMKNFSRCNGRGVDLMRNAPVHSAEASFGVGGQSLSRKLPWYRGNPEQSELGMEPELWALQNYLRKQTENSEFTIALDLHSGFGWVDQIWFPFAKSKDPFPFLPELNALKTLFENSNPHHLYRFEPQSKHYLTHGDLWDFLLLKKIAESGLKRPYLPLTLEMGSWNWIKKNPIQLFTASGSFNPTKLHRQKRTLRRHLPFFDFLLQACASPGQWSELTPSEREQHQRKGEKMGETLAR